MESALSVRLLYGPYLDVVLSSSLFFLCYWPFACSIVLPLLLALLLFADSTPRYNHITSVHVVTQNNERFHYHAKLCKPFTKIYKTIGFCEARTIGSFGTQFY